MFQQDRYPFSHVCSPVQMRSHRHILSCSLLPTRELLLRQPVLCRLDEPPEKALSPLTHSPARQLIPCTPLLHALNDDYVSAHASALSGCNFSPLEQTHTCFTLRLQNGRNKALSIEILLKQARGRPGDIIKQLNKDQYTFSLEILLSLLLRIHLIPSCKALS